MTTLPHDVLLAIHRAATNLGLVDARAALLAGIDRAIISRLPVAAAPGAQMLSDLDHLNRLRADNVSLLRRWLENAAALTAPLFESRVFGEALSMLSEVNDPPRAARFIGRDYLFSAVESFVESERCGYLSICGASGMGKSTFLAEYAQRSGCIVCLDGLTVDGIGAALRDRFGISVYCPPGAKQDEVLADILRRSARRLEANELLVIGVDAVDEATVVGPAHAWASPLPATLPDRVFLLLAHRNQPTPLAVSVPHRCVDMREHVEANEADARAFIHAAPQYPELRAWCAARSLSETEFVSELARWSQGNLLYLSHLLRGVGDGRYRSHTLASLPRDLHHYYEERWEGLAAVAPLSTGVRDAVAYVLAEARAPVSVADVVNVSGVAEPALRAMLAEIGDLLCTEQAGANVVHRIEHVSFREFLYWQDSVQACGAALAGDHPTIDATLSTLLGGWGRSPARRQGAATTRGR